MKLKFINLLLASTLLAGSAQVFTSCKDNEADLYSSIQVETMTLKEAVDQHQKDLENLKPRVVALESGLQDVINDLGNKADKAEVATQIAAAISDLTTTRQVLNLINTAIADLNIPDLTARVVTLEGDVANIKATLNTLVPDVEALKTTVEALKGDVSEIKTNFETLKGDVEALKTWKSGVDQTLIQVQADAAAALAKANKNEADIDALRQTVEKIKSCECDPNLIALLETKVKNLETEVVVLRQEAAANLAAAKQYADGLVAALDHQLSNSISALSTKLNNLQKQVDNLSIPDVAALKADIKKNADAIDKINKDLSQLLNRVGYLENRVTSIIMQEVDNHIYGTLLTPFGISSNLMIAYAGATQVEVDFPSTDNEYDNDCPLTSEDIMMLAQCGLKLTTIDPGVIIDRNNNNLGNVYFTVNPSNIDISGKTFSLVNSLGQTQGIELKGVGLSTHQVEHGVGASRALTNFYEADVYIAPQNAGKIAFTIDKSLENAVAEIFKAGRNTNAGLIASLAKALYNQVDGILPAYAINASWTENGVAYNTTGQLNMAVATVTPLSFTTLYGKKFNKSIPDLSVFLNKFKEKVHVNLDGDDYHITLDKSFTIPGCNIEIRDVTIQISDLKTEVLVKMPVYANLNDKENGIDPIAWAEGTINVDFSEADLKALNEKLTAQINWALRNAGVDIQTSVDNMINDIQGSVVDMLTSMETTVNSTIDEVLADLQGKINGKIENFVDRIEGSRVYDLANKVIDRLNDVIHEPNHYLQVGLFYKSNSGFGLMSTSKNHPTVVNAANNANGLLLIPTTLTAEVICPAYEKFVAVTNVYKGSASAQGGDATCLQYLKQDNAKKNVCEVLDGRYVTAPLYFGNAKGYTFEITYQAVDYKGSTSTQKYYVKIK